ncbi:hypothetical protein HII31_07080 [Pseudocercospora fuligena]|uniref:F-box domain-containing protein n=1 Tax=Pseudocercospora fuligena TaxID=685502 RepID=A0A8H6VGK5_9PEZI|nr:hypothetical protein HII31_07080 [Pseudocercospora fuligena]
MQDAHSHSLESSSHADSRMRLQEDSTQSTRNLPHIPLCKMSDIVLRRPYPYNTWGDFDTRVEPQRFYGTRPGAISHSTRQKAMFLSVSKPRTTLLDLPAELRNRIYENCLCITKNTTAPFLTILSRSKGLRRHGRSALKTWCYDEDRPPPLSTALLRVSRQLNEETMPILYGSNIISLNYHNLPRFLEACGERKKYIRHLRIVRLYAPGPGLSALEDLPNLRSLMVTTDMLKNVASTLASVCKSIRATKISAGEKNELRDMLIFQFFITGSNWPQHLLTQQYNLTPRQAEQKVEDEMYEDIEKELYSPA